MNTSGTWIRFVVGGAMVLSAVCVFAEGESPLSAQSCPELVSKVPYGPSRAVSQVGDHAYFSSGAVLMIADVTDPAAPVVVGELELPGEIREIKVLGGYAHIACNIWGYWMVDVSVPLAPVVAGSFTSSLGPRLSTCRGNMPTSPTSGLGKGSRSSM